MTPVLSQKLRERDHFFEQIAEWWETFSPDQRMALVNQAHNIRVDRRRTAMTSQRTKGLRLVSSQHDIDATEAHKTPVRPALRVVSHT